MRQPFQHQILFPMAGVMLVTLTSVSAIDVWLAARQSHMRIVRQLQSVSATIAESSFPLTDGVLRQMRGLSGAQFIVTSRNGRVEAASYPRNLAERLPVAEHSVPSAMGKLPRQLALDRPMDIEGERMFHAAFDLPPLTSSPEGRSLHVLYPVARYQRAWFEAVWPRLGIGVVSLAVVMLVSQRIARRMTRPLFRVRDHMEQVAAGRFKPIEVPRRDDEIRDLSLAMNRTAALLADYEEQVRRDEQLRTLGRLGGAVAHQIRNAVTGCRVALQLHREECAQREDECLAVAIQQLDLLEGSLRRFLAVKQRQRARRETVDLTALIDNTLPLVAPQARHVGVQLEWNAGSEPIGVVGDAEGLREVIVNLLLNAIDAAAAPPSREGPQSGEKHAIVIVTLESIAGEQARLCVLDSGPGPAAAIQQQLFEPLVSTKPEGAGLGLSVAREIVLEHDGHLTWDRVQGKTRFMVELPLGCVELTHVTTASR